MMSKEFVYRAEYSLSDRAACKKCGNTMAKNVLRLCIMEQSRWHDGKDALWHHPRCFFQRKPNVKPDEIWHFHDIRYKDQLRVWKLAKGKSAREDDSDEEDEPEEPVELKANGKRGAKQGTTSSKKKKSNPDSSDDTHAAKMRVQNDVIWTCRDLLTSLPKKAMQAILVANDQHVPVAGKMLDRLTDTLVFGAPKKCTVCDSETGHIVISADAYYCIGSVNEWAECDFKTQTPERKPLVLPTDLLEKYPFLQNYAGKRPKERVFPLCFQIAQHDNRENGKLRTGLAIPSDGPSTSKINVAATSSAKKAGKEAKEPLFDTKLPFTGLKIGAAGTLPIKRADMIKTISSLGGQYIPKLSQDVFVVISNTKTIDLRPVTLEMAQVCSIHVVPVEFLDECQTGQLKKRKDLVEIIERLKINTWPASAASLLEKMVSSKAGPSFSISGLSSSEQHRLQEQAKNRRYENSGESNAKIVVKNGSALDPDSDLDASSHSVYRENKEVYAYVLAKTNVNEGTNSFYKMQIIKRDGREEYYLFRAWGRIGTVIGGTKCDEMERDEAIEEFEFHFMDKTKNEWKNRHQFVKKPSKYFIMEMDYGPEETEVEQSVVPGSKTKLKKPIQDVIRMIFDVETMEKTMKMFEIDMRKMPLGKMSRKQITEGMGVLAELQTLIQAGERSSSPRIMGATNRFFTLIPHDFGVSTPLILNELTLVKDKLEMLENLLEIEVAFSMLRSENKNSNDDPLDQHYEKLKCGMEVVEKSAPEYKQICQYVENTHAATHKEYKLKVLDIFQLARQGESERFDKFRKLHNHKLLWHGSRTTNYAGILSQGLRIAPPEAPVTVYMFGKGVYFGRYGH